MICTGRGGRASFVQANIVYSSVTVMTSLSVLSWNVQGLNGVTKRAACLNFIDKNHVDVALIQESHLTSKSVKSFSNSKYEVVASSSVDDKTKGVLIAVRRSLDLNIIDIGGDNEGRIAFVKVIMSNMKFIFVSAYAPADYDKKLYSELSNLLMNSLDYYLVIGADMNTIIDPMLDKSNPRVGSAQLSVQKHYNSAC